mmetsp:Transcript_23873/g.42261  ORF Transcript_23873/g.42261 Transcript_23873/m.42261 type:complete len:311 (+) Transcript_23873:23-955(+)
MESKPLVFETPDPPQTIDEINAALLARVPLKGLSGIETGNTELKVKDIFQFFEDLTSAPPKVNYRRDTPAPLPTSEKLLRIQAEVKELLTDPNIDDESKQALIELAHQLEGLHDLNSGTATLSEPAPEFNYEESDFAGGVSFTLKVDPETIAQADALKLAELEVEIRRLEKLVGVKEVDLPASKQIHRINNKLELLDITKLESIESQAKSLGNELDMLSSSKSEFSLETYALEGLRELSVLEFPDLLEVAEKLAVSKPMHDENLRLATSLAKLELLADSLLELVDEDADVLEELQKGLEENAELLGMQIN